MWRFSSPGSAVQAAFAPQTGFRLQSKLAPKFLLSFSSVLEYENSIKGEQIRDLGTALYIRATYFTTLLIHTRCGWIKKEAFYLQLRATYSPVSQRTLQPRNFISETNTQLTSLMSDSFASLDSRRPTVKQIMINIIKFKGFTRINRIKIILNCCTILTTEDAERSILFFLTGRL